MGESHHLHDRNELGPLEEPFLRASRFFPLKVTGTI